ncbi:type III-B CRISPR module RAMP protein Cmr1 [Thermobifida alba]|uniref:Type III-B CRISPR module RAMP protein Cmr1 n=1 Tax=Thermobifida alba TaxID=53522 RepID=A0ABY4L2U9_THEAE|nr:type III-B CRISPR module RAMP protein Cmr1 [Thermobifida alba]UPT20643.1 type III-B CRISPR module RAMP protein Cmr1 [Thermobifida alba]
MSWITLRLRVTTPLFNGNDHEPLRVSSLRGVMRYWFRALAGSKVGPDVRTLRRLEDMVFGSTEKPCPVRLRLAGLPRVQSVPNILKAQPVPDIPDAESAIGYLLGQGLGTITGGDYYILRPYVRPDNHNRYFKLKIALSKDEPVDALTLASLWMVCAYGGVGARTRRGFGGLRIIGVSPNGHDLPAPWEDPGRLATPGLDHYRELDQLQRLQPIGPLADCLRHIDTLLTRLDDTGTARPWQVDETPTYPVFSGTRTCAGLSAYSAPSWEQLLAHVGWQYRLSRATSDNSASSTNYWPKIKTPEREAVIRGNSDHFPLGALGLPVVYSKDRVTVGERRASPLWLRPVGEDGEWKLFSFAFHSAFLPETTEVQLRRTNGGNIRSVAVTDDDIVTRTSDWVQRMRSTPAPYHLPQQKGQMRPQRRK